MLKILICFCTLFIGTISIASAAPRPLYCDPQLQRHINTIQKIPEAAKLIESIQKEGPIQICANREPLSQQFGAYWDGQNRVICVNTSQRSEGAIIGSIIFELHNAAINSKINECDALAASGQIDRENYVRSIEYLEYQNSLMSSNLAKKGIEMRLIPNDARLPTYRNFEEHYRMQKIGGHSAFIAKNYDSIAPRGINVREKLRVSPSRNPKIAVNKTEN